MTRVRSWLEGFWVQVAALALVLLSIAAGTFAQVEASRRERCVEHWADVFTARVQIITVASQKRSDALDALLLVAGGQDLNAKITAYNAYLKASQEYRRTLGDHPLPEPPKLRC
jgi:uncharacterized iron-regulated protein